MGGPPDYRQTERIEMNDKTTGTDRVREAIKRDHGGHLAPQQPVTLCGGPERPADAMRADDPRWPGNHARPAPRPSAISRVGEVILGALFCPGCLRFRFGPGHLSRKLSGIDCRHAW
jgi:hypothetical protein